MMAAIPHDCESKFLYWLMSRIDFRRLVQDGAVPSVNQSQLEEIVIALPNTSEQKDIAVRLDFLASVIEEKTAVRDAMVSVRAGLLQDLLTGKVRVKVN
jgi:type I restriction enzyme S subunit